MREVARNRGGSGQDPWGGGGAHLVLTEVLPDNGFITEPPGGVPANIGPPPRGQGRSGLGVRAPQTLQKLETLSSKDSVC